MRSASPHGGADDLDGMVVRLQVALGILQGSSALAEHVERAQGYLGLAHAACERLLDGSADHELAADDAHRSAHGESHQRFARFARQVHDPSRSIRLDGRIQIQHAARQHQPPCRCIDEQRLRLSGMRGPIARRKLFGDQAIRRRIVWDAQQCLRDAHEGDPLLIGQAEFLQKGVQKRPLAPTGAGPLHQCQWRSTPRDAGLPPSVQRVANNRVTARSSGHSACSRSDCRREARSAGAACGVNLADMGIPVEGDQRLSSRVAKNTKGACVNSALSGDKVIASPGPKMARSQGCSSPVQAGPPQGKGPPNRKYQRRAAALRHKGTRLAQVLDARSRHYHGFGHDQVQIRTGASQQFAFWGEGSVEFHPVPGLAQIRLAAAGKGQPNAAARQQQQGSMIFRERRKRSGSGDLGDAHAPAEGLRARRYAECLVRDPTAILPGHSRKRRFGYDLHAQKSYI